MSMKQTLRNKKDKTLRVECYLDVYVSVSLTHIFPEIEVAKLW